MVKRLLNLKKCLKKRRGELKEAEIVLIRVHLGTGRQLILLWCKCSNSLLSGIIGYPYRRRGDSFCVRETPGLSGRVGMYVSSYRSLVFVLSTLG